MNSPSKQEEEKKTTKNDLDDEITNQLTSQLNNNFRGGLVSKLLLLKDQIFGSSLPSDKQLVRKRAMFRKGIILLTGVSALSVFSGIFAKPLTNLAGFLWPLYQSFKALQSEDKEDDTFWLTYWVVYGSFTLSESFVSWLLFKIPFYHIAKMIFLLLLYLPQTKGALYLFRYVLSPLLSKYEPKIDQQLGMISQEAKKIGVDVVSGSSVALKAVTRSAVQAVVETVVDVSSEAQHRILNPSQALEQRTAAGQQQSNNNAVPPD
jgi:receptor expression-enhancing protein 5/6